MPRRRRSNRSHVVELLLVAAAIGGLWLWRANGGPRAFGEWFGPMFAP